MVRAERLPENALCGLFQGTESTANPVGSLNVCVSGMIRRVGGIRTAAAGAADFDVDLIGVNSGESVYLQCIHRDPVGSVAATSAVTFSAE